MYRVVSGLEIAKLVIDGVGAVAAGVVAVAAWRGISTWRAQLGGTAEHETARRVLHEIYRFEHLVNATRDLFSSTSDAAGRVRSPDETPDERVARDSAHAYGIRMAKVVDSRDQLRLVELEALALWGERASGFFEPFYRLTNQLGHAQRDFFSDTEQGARRLPRDPALQERIRGIVWGGTTSPDPYTDDLRQAVAAAEDYFRGFMVSGGASRRAAPQSRG